MRLHERFFLVQKADAEISSALLDLYQKHGLTYGEIVRILSSQLDEIAKCIIRQERNPDDPNKKGDEA